MLPDYRLLVEELGMERFARLCTILAEVDRHGSLRRATVELGLSYRYAWGLVKQAEKLLEAPLLSSRVGGAAGGSTELTESAKELVRRQQQLRAEVETRVEAILSPGHSPEGAAGPLLMASTIGPVETGLVEGLATAYHAATGLWVRYIPAGTGQALVIARTGRVDLVLVHAPEWEESFVAEGYGTQRYPLMYDQFVLCGPRHDPAQVGQAASIKDAFCRIAAAQARFLTRGDQSGTHAQEIALWEAAGISPVPPWYCTYEQGGRGSIATLRHADQIGAYTLVDRATFTVVAPAALAPLYEDDPQLMNRFSLIPLSPGRYPAVNHAGAGAFAAWATGPEGQAFISNFGVEQYGRLLYMPADG